jgi:uncharacterized protein YcfL
MRRILLLSFISLCAIVFAGCSKEENVVVPNFDSQEAVTVPQDPVAAVPIIAPVESEQVTAQVLGSAPIASDEQVNLANQEKVVILPIAPVPGSAEDSDSQKQPQEAAEEPREQNIAVNAQDVHADTMTMEVQES